MFDQDLQRTLEERYGLDISFDAQFGLRGTKDVMANQNDTDYRYVAGPVALAEELQRLFDLTPKGSFIDDPGYGIDLDFIGQPNNVGALLILTKIACLNALKHPSFATRFRVAALDVAFDPNEPNALRVVGVLECYGFESVPYWRFGPYMLRYLRS